MAGIGPEGAGGTWVLACDLGSTSLRAGLVGPDGEVVAEASLPAPEPVVNGAACEVDPDLWWQGFTQLCAHLAAGAGGRFAEVAAVAVCGATRAQVCLGADGAPLRPAMVWNDTRAAAEAEHLGALAGDHAEAAQLNAFHPLARLAWLRRHEPAVAGAIRALLEPKDFINARLTGVLASDPVSMARISAAASGVDNLLGRAGYDAGLIPPLHLPWRGIGTVRSGLPPPLDRLAGRRVVAGSNDTYAAVIGLGAMHPGGAYNISGTTEVLGVLDARPAAAEGLIGLDWCGLHHLGGPSQNGADVARWLAGIVGWPDVARLDAVVAGARRDRPLLFLPYLSGERVPYWDADLRGAFLGLARGHGPADLALAVLEGVAFQNRVVLERAEAARGARVAQIRMGGGGAASAAWRQVKADVLGRPVTAGSAREPGLTGAAALAFCALGTFGTLAAAQERMSHALHRHDPDPARAGHYHRLFALFRQAEGAVAPLSRALAGF